MLRRSQAWSQVTSSSSNHLVVYSVMEDFQLDIMDTSLVSIIGLAVCLRVANNVMPGQRHRSGVLGLHVRV